MSWRPPAEPYFEIRRSGIQGRGAFAVRPIRKGTRIIEYTGEVITQDEGDRRYDDESMARHHTFLFDLDDGTVVDGAVGGSDAATASFAASQARNGVRPYMRVSWTVKPPATMSHGRPMA